MKESDLLKLANDIPIKITRKYLRDVAGKLPRSVMPVKTKQLGSHILKYGNYSEEEKKKINPTDFYWFPSYQKINHLRQLNLAYKQGGRAGLHKYFRWFLRHHKWLLGSKDLPMLIKTPRRVKS